MKKVLLTAAMAVILAGCQTTQLDRENMAFAAGSALAMGYSSQQDQLTPEQKKMAAKAIEVFAQAGETITPENLNDLDGAVDAALAKNIQDPKQLAMARSFTAVFLKTVKPYLKNQTAQDGILILGAFSKGLSAASL